MKKEEEKEKRVKEEEKKQRDLGHFAPNLTHLWEKYATIPSSLTASILQNPNLSN